jgi:hypothetical protein
VAEKVSALRTEEHFRKGVTGLIAPKPCGFLNVLDKGIPLSKAMNFARSGGRSQAAKRRMREIRPSGDRRKGPLLNSGATLRRQPRSFLWMCCRRLKGGGNGFALFHLGLTSRFRGKTSYWVSPASTFWWYSSTASFHS